MEVGLNVETVKGTGFGKNIAKGIVIGVANIIPGVSGGTLAVSMGVYDKIIGAVTGMFKNLKKSILTLLPFAIGMALGIGGLSFLIEWLFLNFPFQTNLLFCGLILGCIPLVWDNVKGHKITSGNIIICMLLVVVVLGSSFMGKASNAQVVLTADVKSLVLLFLVGVIAAATMVIPGVSGSMMLTIMGYYFPVLSLVNRTIEAVFTLNFPVLLGNMVYLVPFGAGVVVGIFIIAKFMEFLLSKQKVLTYWGILGLVAASPVAIFISSGVPTLSLMPVVTGLLAFIVGVGAARKLSV